MEDISDTQRAVGDLLSERLVRQELQLSGELSAMTAERSDVSGALLAILVTALVYGLGGALGGTGRSVVPVSGGGPGVAGAGRAGRAGTSQRRVGAAGRDLRG